MVERHGDAAWLSSAFADGVVVGVRDGGVTVIRGADGRPQLAALPEQQRGAADSAFFLGRAAGRNWFAAPAPAAAKVVGLRDLGPALDGWALELAVCAAALASWHEREPCCSRCGAPTTPMLAGWARACPACGGQHFPRTDPAVIVAIIDAHDRLLLGHQSSWPPGRMSVLAGFVEAGESAEQAVHREVAEEAGVLLTDVRYVASQPWPFPRSLMLGFQARTHTERITVDGVEIVEAGFFTRGDVRAGVADGTLGLPGAASIAYRLIHDWLRQDGGPWL